MVCFVASEGRWGRRGFGLRLSGCGLLGVLLWGLRRDAATQGFASLVREAGRFCCGVCGVTLPLLSAFGYELVRLWRCCACFGVFGLGGKYFYDGLTSTALPAMVFDVKTTSAARPQTGDSLRASCFTLGQQAGVPVGESHGGGARTA